MTPPPPSFTPFLSLFLDFPETFRDAVMGQADTIAYEWRFTPNTPPKPQEFRAYQEGDLVAVDMADVPRCASQQAFFESSTDILLTFMEQAMIALAQHNPAANASITVSCTRSNLTVSVVDFATGKATGQIQGHASTDPGSREQLAQHLVSIFSMS